VPMQDESGETVQLVWQHVPIPSQKRQLLKPKSLPGQRYSNHWAGSSAVHKGRQLAQAAAEEAPALVSNGNIYVVTTTGLEQVGTTADPNTTSDAALLVQQAVAQVGDIIGALKKSLEIKVSCIMRLFTTSAV
jgi:hypothetical protein